MDCITKYSLHRKAMFVNTCIEQQVCELAVLLLLFLPKSQVLFTCKSIIPLHKVSCFETTDVSVTCSGLVHCEDLLHVGTGHLLHDVWRMQQPVY